jgi:hypothetical protein
MPSLLVIRGSILLSLLVSTNGICSDNPAITAEQSCGDVRYKVIADTRLCHAPTHCHSLSRGSDFCGRPRACFTHALRHFSFRVSLKTYRRRYRTTKQVCNPISAAEMWKPDINFITLHCQFLLSGNPARHLNPSDSEYLTWLMARCMDHLRRPAGLGGDLPLRQCLSH